MRARRLAEQADLRFGREVARGAAQAEPSLTKDDHGRPRAAGPPSRPARGGVQRAKVAGRDAAGHARAATPRRPGRTNAAQES